jgi:hypothetical protein
MINRLDLKALFILFALISFVVVAQEDNSNNNEEFEEEVIEEVITTGSRISRNPLELAQPVTIISGDEYRARAYTNAAQALTDLPEVGSVNSLSGDQGGLGAGQQVASNFGLGSSRTVTLVNSRRFVGSQSPTGGAGSGLAVDLNNIPSALIERVEILPVGGAAVYGADAIAGVVNFILKDDYEGAELTVNHYDYAGMDEDSSFNFTIGGNFADGRGNIVLNAQVEDRGQVFYDQANDRIRNCTNGFLYENPQDSGQDIYGNVGYTYEQELSSGWDVNGLADAQGRRSFGDNGLHICPTLVSNPNEGLPTPYGYNEVGADAWWGGQWPDGNYYYFDGPGNLVQMDPGVPYGRNYYTRGSNIYNIQDNKILRAGFERKNVSIFVKYDINDDHRMYFDIYNNRFFAEDDGSSSSAHYSDYWFGAVDSDNCNAGGRCWSTSTHLPITINNPYLTDASKAIFTANGLDDGTPVWLQRLWVDLSPTLRGDGFENENNTQFYNAGFEGKFEIMGESFNYDIGSSWGETRILSTEPVIIGARFAAALDYGINPATGEIDCKFNYEDDYALAATGFQEDTALSAFNNVPFGGGVGLGTPGDCSPFNPMGFNNPDNAGAKEYFTSFENEGAKINQKSFYWNVSGELPGFELPYGPVEFALGYDTRKEKARFDASQLALYSVAVRGSQTRSTRGHFDIESQYLELSFPIVSGLPFADEVRVDYGYREMENTNTLRTNNYDVDALSLYWRINDDFALRFSDQSTTKSPNISDLYSPKNPSFQQALDPCDTRYVDDGDFPANRLANCTADGIDTTDFRSFVAGGTVQGTSGGNPNLLDENGETTSYGLIFTPTYDFLEPYGDFTFSADFIEIMLTDYVTTFSLIDFMEACYDAASFPNNFCNNFQRDPVTRQVTDFQVGAGNSGVIDFATWIYRINWSHDLATVIGRDEGSLGDIGISWRGLQQDQRFVADSGDPEDLVDKTGWASDPEWSWDLAVSWSYKDLSVFYQADFVDGGYVNKQQTDIRADRYIGYDGKPFKEYDSYWFDTIGAVYNYGDNMTFAIRISNPLDHDGSEGRYDTNRRLSFIGRTITTQFQIRF